MTLMGIEELFIKTYTHVSHNAAQQTCNLLHVTLN